MVEVSTPQQAGCFACGLDAGVLEHGGSKGQVKTHEPNSYHERQGKRRDAPDECMAFEIARRSRLALPAEVASRSRCSNVCERNWFTLGGRFT